MNKIDKLDGGNRKDVYWEVRPPFTVSRFLGVSPMDDRFVLSKLYLALSMSMLFVSISFGMVLGVYMEKTNKIFDMSGFSLILERGQLFIIVLTVVVSCIKSVANVKTVFGVMKKFAALDRMLHDIGIHVPYSRLYGYVLTSIRLTAIMSICLPDIVVFKSFTNISFLLVQYNLIVPLLVGNVVQVQFMVLLELAQRRIRIMTDKLKEIGSGNNFIKTQHLHTLISVHSSLISTCEIINSLYSPQILIILSSIFIVTTANLYHVIEKLIVFLQTKKLSELNFVGMTSYRIFIRSMEVWTMVTACVNTHELVSFIFLAILYH